MEQPNSTPRPSIFLFISITSCWFVAQMSYYAQTQLFGPLMERYSLGEAQVTAMMSQETMAYALTALIIAGPLSRTSRVQVAMFGGFVVIASNLVAGSTENFELLRFARLVTGFGGGMIGAAGTAAAASSLNPQRVFAIISVSWGVMAAIQPILVPYLTVPYGAAGGYYGMAVAAAVFMPFFIWLLPPRVSEIQSSLNTHAADTASWFEHLAERLGVRGAPNARFALVVMGGLFVYEIGQGTTQVFLEQFGLRSGMEEYRIGQVMGVATFAGLSGGVIAAWLGTRFGNLRPVILGITGNAIFAAALAIGDSPIAFAVFYLLWNIAYYFLVPYMLGVLSEMDEKGRWAVAVEAVWWFGAAPGAAVGGIVVEATGYPGLAATPLILGAVCVVLLLQVLRQFYASQAKAGQETA